MTAPGLLVLFPAGDGRGHAGGDSPEHGRGGGLPAGEGHGHVGGGGPEHGGGGAGTAVFLV